MPSSRRALRFDPVPRRAALGLFGAVLGLAVAGPSAAAASPVSTFCAHLPAAKVSSIVGTGVAFRSATVVKGTLECEYAGPVVVVILKEPGLPAAKLATRASAEATAKSGFPAGTRIAFSALPALGASAFSWTATIAGTAFNGIGANKGTTGYGVEVSGSPRIATDERLIKLGMSA
jgi:hypothetical protein